MSSLICEAVREQWGDGPPSPEDLAKMESAFGSWKRDDDLDSVAWVDELRSHDRLAEPE